MSVDNLPFPTLPHYQAEGLPVFMEPIAGSGERLCVAVAAHGLDGKSTVVPVIRPETAKCMLGDAGPAFIDMIDVVVSSLEHHLKGGAGLDQWSPPMTGIYPGEIQRGRVTDLTMMLRTLARNSAFISRMSDFSADDDVETSPGPDRWLSLVKDAVADRRPELVRNFSRKLNLYTGGSSTTFDYVGDTYVAQLSRIMPGSNFAMYNKVAKAKLWELISLRDKGHTGLFELSEFELILHRPEKSDPTFSEREIARVNEAFNELEAEGDKQELRVKGVSTPYAAADRIIAADAA